MTDSTATQVKADASLADQYAAFPLADYAISETTVKRAYWENLQVAPCPDANHLNVCNYSHPIEEKQDHTHTVTIENGMPVACTCAAFEYNEGLCKHCLACAADADAIEIADTSEHAAKVVTDGGTTDPLGDVDRTGDCEYCHDTGTTDNGTPCFICLSVTDSPAQPHQSAAVVTDGGQEAFDPDAETVTDAWEDTFLSTSWGYDQTNVELAQIVEVSDTGKTVLACRVAAELIDRTKGSEHLRPLAERFGEEFRLHVRNSGGDPAFRGSYPLGPDGDMDESTRRGWFRPVDDTVRQTAPNYRH